MCESCGTATTDPFPSPAELERAYGDWYRPAGDRRFAGFGDRVLARTRAALAARVDAQAPPGPVLDVGAGSGWLVDALARRGRSVTGLERSGHRPDLADAAITDLDGDWAAVVFWHSLEHVADAGDAVAAAARLLRSDGVLVVAVPDNSSLQARVFGDGWLHLDLPRHLVHLTRAAVLTRLETLGLSVQRTSGIRGGQVVIGWLDGMVGRLPGELDLYASLRRDSARAGRVSRTRRLGAIAAGIALYPIALVCAAVEVAARRSGTLYVEARKGPSSSTA